MTKLNSITDYFYLKKNRGFLKGDKLLGTCLVKLQQLENASIIHDAFDVSYALFLAIII